MTHGATRTPLSFTLLLVLLVGATVRAQGSPEERAARLRGEGEPLRAAELYREAIVAAGEGPAAASTIILYSKEAACYRQAGRFERELGALEECRGRLDDADLVPSQRDVFSINVLVDSSRCLQNLGRLRASMRAAREAAELAGPLTAANPGLCVRAFNELGLAHHKLGQLPEALASLERTRDLLVRLAPASPDLIAVDINLLQVRAEFGQLDAALRGFEDLDSRLRRSSVALQRRFWVVPQRLGILHFERGDYEASLELNHRALELLEDVGLADTLSHAMTLLDGTYSARRLGRFAESLAGALEAMEMLEELAPSGHPQVARALHCRGASLLGLRRADPTRPLKPIRDDLEAALALCRESGDQHLPAATVALARFHLEDLGDLDRAETLMREAIAHAETMRERAFALGDLERAAYFRRVRLGRELDPYEGMAQVMVRRGRIAEAVDYLERSRARGTLDKLRLAEADPTEAMRRRAVELGDLERIAELDEREAELATARGTGHFVGSDLAPRGRDVTVGAAVPASIDTIRALLGADERLLFYDLRPGACRVFVVAPTGGDCSAHQLVDSTGGPLTSAALETRVSAYRRMIRSEGRSARRRGIEEEEGEDEVSSAALGHELFRLLMPEKAWDDVAGSSLVYVVPSGCLRSLAFETLVITAGPDPERSQYWVDVGPTTVYAASGSLFVWAAERRRAQVSGDRSDEMIVLADPVFEVPEAEAGSTLTGIVVARVRGDGAAARAGLRAGDVLTTVNGVPAAAATEALAGTGRLELGVLRGDESITRTVAAGDRHWTLSDRPAPAALLELIERSVRTRDMDLAALPGTRAEAERIERLFTATGSDPLRVTRLEGIDAHEGLLHATAPRARILHLATHQVENPDGRWGAGRLALTRAATPTTEDDGYLDLDDLLVRWSGRLDACELVVLSACRSRLGRDQDDEGLFAIPWGFQAAGCPAIVASLWPVDDEVTAALMTAFYSRMGKGNALDAAALRAASRAVRREFPAPYHWAPFIWIGAPR